MSILDELLTIEHKAQHYEQQMRQDLDKKEQLVADRLNHQRRALVQERQAQAESLRQKIETALGLELADLQFNHGQAVQALQAGFDVEREAQALFEQVVQQTFGVALLAPAAGCGSEMRP